MYVMTYSAGFAEWTYPAGFAELSMERQNAWRMLQAHSSREKMKEMQASSARIKERTARIKERTARLLERGPQFDREVALERGKFFPSLPFPARRPSPRVCPSCLSRTYSLTLACLSLSLTLIFLFTQYVHFIRFWLCWDSNLRDYQAPVPRNSRLLLLLHPLLRIVQTPDPLMVDSDFRRSAG